MIYLPGGEGCLSVDRETCGITPRHQKITVEAHLYNLQTGSVEFKKFELTDYIAIVFQHEYDHLNGILFVDRANKTNPKFIPDNSKPIQFKEN